MEALDRALFLLDVLLEGEPAPSGFLDLIVRRV
jgi:hypothetical protein